LILFEVERGDGSVQYASNKWEGWLILDRVMDAPVYQAELTWDRSDQASLEVVLILLFGPKSSTPRGACNGEECGLLADS
jgi:hypothetical protein